VCAIWSCCDAARLHGGELRLFQSSYLSAGELRAAMVMVSSVASLIQLDEASTMMMIC
jgi:hypothetical protein